MTSADVIFLLVKNGYVHVKRGCYQRLSKRTSILNATEEEKKLAWKRICELFNLKSAGKYIILRLWFVVVLMEPYIFSIIPLFRRSAILKVNNLPRVG